jgi:hypothetical protein
MLSFPLATAVFWDRLPISQLDLDLGEAMELSRTASGDVLTADLGDRLWQGSVTLGRMTYAEFGEVEAVLEALRQAGRSFLAYDRRRPGPKLDSSGAVLGAASPVIASLGVTARTLTLGGLPSGYGLSSGDYLGFAYSGGGAPGLHRIVSPAQADAGGVTGEVEIIPALRPGPQVGNGVNLMRPLMQAKLIPGSVNKGTSRRGITEAVSFSFTQTMRA